MGIKREILVLSHPRNGTGYAAKALTSIGMQVGHETMQAGGTSNWQWAVQADSYPFGDQERDAYEFTRVLHIMREPLAAIASVAFTEFRSESWRREMLGYQIPDRYTPIEAAISSLLRWHKLCAEQATDRCQTEQMDVWIKRTYGTLPRIGKSQNARKHPAIEKSALTGIRNATELNELTQMYNSYEAR